MPAASGRTFLVNSRVRIIRPGLVDEMAAQDRACGRYACDSQLTAPNQERWMKQMER